MDMKWSMVNGSVKYWMTLRREARTGKKLERTIMLEGDD
jgi:hypothetical protein